MNKSLKAFLTSAGMCPVDDITEVVMSLNGVLYKEAWVLVLEREDVKDYLCEKYELARSVLHDKSNLPPVEFMEFCNSLPELEGDVHLRVLNQIYAAGY